VAAVPSATASHCDRPGLLVAVDGRKGVEFAGALVIADAASRITIDIQVGSSELTAWAVVCGRTAIAGRLAAFRHHEWEYAR
jgi:hypothetical protein